jgi:probable HAF family extracellular repeat protein
MTINDRGEVVGVSSGFSSNQGVVRAVSWQSGRIKDIGTLGGLHSTANGLNNKGVVVGWADLSDQSTAAFLWHNGVMRNLGSLPGSTIMPGTGGQATAVNESGQVVGSSLNSKGEMHAVIWENGKIIDLNEVILKVARILLTHATDINNRGQLTVEQQIDANGPTRSFLLTPGQPAH